MKNLKPTPTPLNPPLSGGKLEPAAALGSRDQLESGRNLCFPPDKGGPRGVAFIPYNKKLTALAQENRKNPTAAETKMWFQVLRMRHFENLKFIRQKPIGNYIVDFYCAELRLAIEIDGDSHAVAIEYDAARTAALKAQGITVIRYTNDEVLNNLDGVYDDLVAKINVGVPAP